MRFSVLLLVFGFGLAGSSLGREVAEIEVDPDAGRQRIEGFGTAFIVFTEPPAEYADPAFWDHVVNELGLSIARMPMIESMERVNDDGDPDHFEWGAFKMEDNGKRQGMRYRMELLQELKDRGVSRFMASPWSPPDFAKTNRAPIHGGHLRMDRYEEWAEYMSAFVILAKRNWGIDIGYVTLQNELLFLEPYRSCIYNAEQVREQARFLSRKFQREGINTRMLLPEDMMFFERMMNYIRPTMADPETQDFRGEFATHRVGDNEDAARFAEATERYGRRLWMTETSGHQPTWEGALKMASDMHDYLVKANLGGWCYWQISDKSGSSQYSIYETGKPGPKFHAARHYYRFIRPEAVRVQASVGDPDLLVSAFRHDVEGTLTVNVINRSKGDRTVSIDLPHPGLPKSYRFIMSTSEAGSQERGEVSLDGGRIELPAESIATFYGQSAALRTKDKEQGWPTSWEGKVRQAGEPMRGDFSQRRLGRGWPIGEAARQNRVADVHEAIERGELDWERADGWQALHRACLSGAGNAVKLLLEAGAEPNAQTNTGWTAVHAAASNNMLAGEDPATGELWRKSAILGMVLEAGGDATARDEEGWTPLHAAAANAYTAWRQSDADTINRLQMLIDAGADPNARDAQGRTPLHWASWQGYYRFAGGVMQTGGHLVDLLVANGAEVGARDERGRTPLHYAADMGYDQVIVALLRAGADPQATDREGNSAVDLAKAKALHRSARLLQARAKRIHGVATEVVATGQVAENGYQLLQAAWRGDLAEVERLLAEGADLEYRDSDGFSALDRAIDSGHDEIAKRIREAMRQ